ncbi:MAG: hypothetical protein O2958_11045 [Gemmatimonadetes bacterium]|nr:hypothetical protein [Gemmatimonadota bacterium]MDA1103699.1 hypothetical protein [Gemmatimonadota bacterium]
MNRVENSFRDQDESWVEWSPTFGAVVAFPSLDLRYSGRITTGTGRPGIGSGFGPGLETLSASDADFILAPGAALTLQEAQVFTHQISVTIPIR